MKNIKNFQPGEEGQTTLEWIVLGLAGTLGTLVLLSILIR